jgi:DUF4097 and DUF4098 domain-containing protein YvlB
MADLTKPPPSAPQTGDDKFKGSFGLYWPSHCGKKSESTNQIWDFNQPSEFIFYESIEGDDHLLAGISGETHLLPAPADQVSDVRVNFSIATSQPLAVDSVRFSQSRNTLMLNGVSLEWPTTASTNCMVMTSLVYVKPGLNWKNLHIESRNTRVLIHEDLNLVVDTTTITLAKGSLKAAIVDSRKTIIDIVSGSVSGIYALRDLLSIHTQSGSINVGVEPQDALKDDVKPATLDVLSRSGSVKIEYPTTGLPDRDYKTSIDASMGSVTATLVHGSATTINAYSGSIKAEIIPYNASDTPSTLSTYTLSGSTRVKVMSPFNNPGANISSLSSSHKGKSGSINLWYPQEWTGTLEGGTQSGSLKVQGKDVNIIREGRGAAGRHIVAEKGDGESKLDFATMSGSCMVQVGLL